MLNEERKGYKKTKIGWIPNDWTIISLEKVASKIGSGVTPKGGSKVYLDKGIPLVRSQNVLVGKLLIDDAVCITQEQHDKMASTKLKGDDVLLNITGASIGRSCVVPVFIKEGNVNQHVCIIRLDDTYNASLLSTYLNSYIGQKLIASFQSGGNREGLNFQQIKSFPIPYPTIEEQNKIAQILSTWDKAITTLEQLIAKKQELKKGLMQVLLTGKVRFKEFIKNDGFRKTRLENIPKDWNISKLESLGSFSKGKGITKKELSKTGLPCIRYGEIYTSHHVVIKEFLSFINESIVQKSKQIKSGDILFAGSGETIEEIGKAVAYMEDDIAYAGGDIIILTPKNVNSIFLSFALNDENAIRQKRKLGQGNSVVHIYSKGLAKVLVALPSIEEQDKIAFVLLSIDKEISSLKKQVSTIKLQKKGLLQKLLTGAIRVKV